MSESTSTDRRGRSTGLTAEQRRDRARKASAASHSLSAYVARIVRDAPQLSDDQLAQLRQVVVPTDHAAYLEGMKVGAQLASERLLSAVRQVADEELARSA